MAPLIILLVVTGIAHLVLRRQGGEQAGWAPALRFGLAAMFAVTGGSHFIGMREALIDMVPPSLPNPELLVTGTGVLEIAAAIGLLLRPTIAAAATGLTLMLIGMFPANVYAANHDLGTEWVDNLVPRTIMQIIFLAATITVARHYWLASRTRTPETRAGSTAVSAD